MGRQIASLNPPPEPRFSNWIQITLLIEDDISPKHEKINNINLLSRHSSSITVISIIINYKACFKEKNALCRKSHKKLEGSAECDNEIYA